MNIQAGVSTEGKNTGKRETKIREKGRKRGREDGVGAQARGTLQGQDDRSGKGRNIAKERREVVVALTGGPQEGPGIREGTLMDSEHLRGRRGPQCWVRLCGCRSGRATNTRDAPGQDLQLGLGR